VLGSTRFWAIRTPVFAFSWLKRTVLRSTAVNSFTGTLTSPKLIAPVQMGRGTSVIIPTVGLRASVAAGILLTALPAMAAASPILYSSNRCDQAGDKGFFPNPNGGAACDSEIWALDPATGADRQLTFDAVPDYDARWSPDGTRIAFAHGERDYHDFTRIYVMGADGTGARRLTPAAQSEESGPAWSPTGLRIAYTADPNGGPGGALFTIGADGTAPLRLGEGSAETGYLNLRPEYTPDGTRIMFVRIAGFGLPGLWSISAVGGPAFEVATGDVRVNFTGFDLSPDCRAIAFGSRRGDDATAGVYTLDFASGALVQRSQGNDVSPVWAPDAGTLVFTHFEESAGAPANLYALDTRADGAAPVQLTHLTESYAYELASSWGSRLLPNCRVTDVLPPVVEILNGTLGHVLPAVPIVHATAAATRVLRVRRRHLHLLAFDPAGVRSLRAAAARAGSHRRLRYHQIRSARDWSALVSHLRRGRYDLRFVAVDGRGNGRRRTVAVRVRITG